jgi:hypothetical protein
MRFARVQAICSNGARMNYRSLALSPGKFQYVINEHLKQSITHVLTLLVHYLAN